MPAYSYVALNRNGSKKKGIVSAESEREARRLVKDLKLSPLKVTESKDLGKIGKKHFNIRLFSFSKVLVS